MAAVEARHWWYQSLHALVLDALRRSFGDRKDLRILDAGCGTGGMMQALAHSGYADVRGFDLSEHSVRFCRERGLSCEAMDLRAAPERLAPQCLDVILFNDVSYFLPLTSWPALLHAYRASLAAGGVVLMNIPAFKAFRGIHDVAVGISERFSPRDLRRMFDDSDFELESKRFWPFLLSPVILATRVTQRLRLAIRPDTEISSDVDLPSPPVNEALLALTRLERRLSRGWPWGSSLFIELRAV